MLDSYLLKFLPGKLVPRREFLSRCCRAASTASIGGIFSAVSRLRAASETRFPLLPIYAAQTPFDAALANLTAGSDSFVTEKYHDEIAAILAKWRAGILNSPISVEPIGNALAAGFLGTPFRAVATRQVRTGSALAISQVRFEQTTQEAGAFLEQLRQEWSSFSPILIADLQVTRIERSSDLFGTRVLYELVGTGDQLFREQRTGFWDLQWERLANGNYLVRSWRAADEQRSRCAQPWFSDVAEQALGGNSCFAAQMQHGADYWRTMLDGACGIDIYGHNGVSVGDIDNDGFDDLYVCQPAGLPNRLFRNRGDGSLEDITERSGTGILENTASALFADFDNDGRQDLVVVRSNGPLLFLNEGDGRFRRKPDAFQFATPPQGTFTGAAAADYDRDGWLDVYFCLYAFFQGADQYKYPMPYYAAENGPPNFLMRNNGDGTFRDVTGESGLNRNNTRYSFCCGWGDYNGDGWPDLYVVNDFGRKNLYRNNGGTFTDIAAEAGAEDIGAGMSVCWFDYNNDGAKDLYVADMWSAAGERISTQENFKRESSEAVRALYRKHAMGNSLLENRSGKTFRDATATAQVGRGRWSWSSDAWDFDHDGFSDLYVVNGMVSGSLRQDLNSFFWRQVVANSPDNAHPSEAYEQGWNGLNELLRSDYSWRGYERNVFFANNGDGTFSDVSGAVGLDFVEDGRSFALSDFDHDGRQEVFLKNRNAPQLRVLKNVVDSLPPAVAFCLRGTKSNRDAIGAVVTMETATRRQTRMLQAGSGFLSQHSKELFFGVGKDRGPVRATVRWPSGLIQHFDNLPIDHRVRVVEGSEKVTIEPFARRTPMPPASSASTQPIEQLPDEVETWLLAPIAAPDWQNLAAFRGNPFLLTFCAQDSLFCEEAVKRSLPVIHASKESSGVYSILYRYVFDRHRDLRTPVSFLIDAEGKIVKIYQGTPNANTVKEDVERIPRNDNERLACALPFRGVTDTYEFGRNYLSFGSIYFRRGYWTEAAASFRLALRDDPSSAEARYGLGSVYLQQEKLDEARGEFEQTVKSAARYPDTLPNGWNNLGLIAARQQHTAEAIGYFERALELNPDHAAALENLGNAYRQEHQWEKAQEALERALALKPDSPELHYSLGMVFAQTEQPERAYEYLQAALKLRPHYPEALNNLGVLYVRTRRVHDAIAAFERCIELAPGFDQPYLNLARVYALEGDTGKARAILTAVLKQQPNNPAVQRALHELH